MTTGVDRPVPPPLNGTAFIDPDILSLEDSTAFDSVFALGTGSRDMYDRRTDAIGTYDVWLFQADYDDALSVEMRQNVEAAQAVVNIHGSYSKPLASKAASALVLGQL